ncbi:cytochrome P450 2F2-like [Rhinophrynus dorsalis]
MGVIEFGVKRLKTSDTQNIRVWKRMYGGMVKRKVKNCEGMGDRYTVYLGSRPTVVLTGYQVVKEALVDEGYMFLGRGRLPLIEHLFNNSGQPVDPSIILTCASSNVITAILLNTRYDFSDEKWMKILHEMQEGFTIFSSIWGQLYDIFPDIMRFLPGPHKRIFKLLKGIEDVLKERIKHNLETLDSSCPRDYIDCFLIRMEQQKQNQKTPFTMINLIATIYDMFLGGAETTATTLCFGILILIKYPDIQEKLHKEIDEVIGRIRDPVTEDRTKMHYMNAAIHEIQRFSDVFPMGFVRSVTKDTVFRGYHIPKGTDVITLLTSVLQDPSQFKSPGEFNINHFLDENNKFKKNNGFFPFSARKRSCIGESLVRIELFLFFTTLLQKFTLKSAVGPKDLNISPVECGLESLPPVYKVIFIPRE